MPREPDFWCPAETNLAFALSHVFSLHASTSGRPGEPESWEQAAVESCRVVASRTIGAAAELSNKARWCDKSLTSVDHVDLLLKVFPNARLITLYRNCRDFIESALEASQWGLSGFGFEPYSREHPLNHPLALTLYWRDRVRKLLAAEERGGTNVLRVTYESLVLDTAPTLKKMCTFLGASYRSTYFEAEAVFDRPIALGPQDHKINYTSSINDRSIGRGGALPLESLIPEELLAEVDELEQQLYSRPVEHAGDGPEREAGAPVPNASTQQVVEGIRLRFQAFGAARVQRLTGPEHLLSCVVVVESDGAASRITLVNGAISQSREPPTHTTVIRIGAETAQALMDGLIAASVAERRHLVGVEEPEYERAPEPQNYVLMRAFLRTLTDESAEEMEFDNRRSTVTAVEPVAAATG
jgi:hypothetical protein